MRTTSSTTSPPGHKTTVCDTSVVRIFALVDQLDVLSAVLEGTIATPTVVFDPSENPDASGPLTLRSEIAKSEAYWARQATAEAAGNMSRLRTLWQRQDMHPIDMTSTEHRIFAELTNVFGALAFQLGEGEAACIAIATSRGMEAAIDEHRAREIVTEQWPATQTVTSRQLLVRAVARGLITTPQADEIYRRMLEAGYRGPASVWDE